MNRIASQPFSTQKRQSSGKINTADLRITEPSKNNICKTCGTRYSSAKFRKEKCPVCLDDRQYVPDSGQAWISYNSLLNKHALKLKKHGEQVSEIKMVPGFSLSQRAFFLESEEGNILWDCIPFITQPMVDYIRNRGGLKAIAISHPHYYSLMNEWAKAFQCPIYLHEADREWVMDSEEHIVFWSGEALKLTKQSTVIHTGGHFPGSAVLHSELEYPGQSLFIGDSLYMSRNRQHLSAMYSYPNIVPLSNAATLAVFKAVEGYEFDAIFGAFENQNIYKGGRRVFEASYRKYDEAGR